MAQLGAGIVVYLPDTRGVEVSRYGKGNSKLGSDVFTYSRPAGKSAFDNSLGTCPGETPACSVFCFAKRISGPVFDNYRRNVGADVPEIPAECTLLRIHVSGDFDSILYIENWIKRLTERPDVECWAYTRSWRVLALLPALEALRALPNVQLFASMDASTPDRPPADWRRAWIDGDMRADYNPAMRHDDNRITDDGRPSYVCPEETGRLPNCQTCGYCPLGKHNDVTVLEHGPDGVK
jgi:hypothetical protein